MRLKHEVWVAVAAVAAAFALLTTAGVFAQPRADRRWVEHLARMPDIERTESGFSLGGVRDWSYDASGPTTRARTAFQATYGDLRNVWFVVEPHPGMPAMAHTLVLFEFADDAMVGLTIEARREEGEKYSAFWGTFNRFELAYIWATPRDLLTRRAVYLDHEVDVFPLALSDQQKLDFLEHLLDKSEAIERKPRFYNTLHSNCTNELAKTAGLDWDPAFVLTGYSAPRLFEKGVIPGGDFGTVRAKAAFKDRLVDWRSLDDATFNKALLGELRRRLEMSMEVEE